MANLDTLPVHPDLTALTRERLIVGFGRAAEVATEIHPDHIKFLRQRTTAADELGPGSPPYSAVLSLIEGAPGLSPHLALVGAISTPAGWSVIHSFVRAIDNLNVKTVGVVTPELFVYGVRSSLAGIVTMRLTSDGVRTIEEDLSNGAGVIVVDPRRYPSAVARIALVDRSGEEIVRNSVKLR